MRAARFFFLAVPLSCAVLLASIGPRAFAEAPTAVPAEAAPPDSVAPDSLYRIYPMQGAWIDARRIDPWSSNSIRYRTPSGEIGYLDDSKIRSITDAGGHERIDEVLGERKSLGRPREGEERSFGSWLTAPIRSMPDRSRRNYVVTEFGYSGRLGSDPGHGPPESVVFTGLGWMKNVSPHWALGGVIQVESDLEDYYFAGVGVRARRYLGDIWSLEGTAGLFTADYGFETTGGGIPFFGELGANLIGSLTIFTRYEHHDYRYVPHAGFAPPVTLQEVEVTQDALSAGIRMGPRPRFLVIPAVVLVSLLFLAGDSGTSTY